MPRRNEFVDFVTEQMALAGTPRVRPMFGGFGVYLDESIFAIIIADTLYLKADMRSRAEFESQGLRPFVFSSRGRTVETSYFEAPPEVYEDRETMLAWVTKACEAARRKKAK